jgi:4-hydroxyphenylpyruvate dioxygenase
VRHGIATVCLSGTLERKLAAAAAAGFDGVELFEPDLADSPLSPAEVRHLAAELGLTIDLFQPFRDFEGVTPAQLTRNLERAHATFDVMEQLGADTLLVCSNVAPDAIDDDALAAEQLHALAEHAAAGGIRIAYEALAWGRHVSEYDDAWRIVEAAAHPALGICLDSFHILARGTALDTIANIPADKLLFCQLADATDVDVDVLRWSRHHRCLPGQGAFDLVNFATCVLQAGYDGGLSLEVFSDALRDADPDRVAQDARRSLTALEDQLRLPAVAGRHDITGKRGRW